LPERKTIPQFYELKITGRKNGKKKKIFINMRKYKIFKRDLSPGGQVENP
jgi:hypothetical protein